MIVVGLLRVPSTVFAHRDHERFARSEIAVNGCGIPRTRMRLRQCPAAERRKLRKNPRDLFTRRDDLHIAKLPNVVILVIYSNVPEEEIGCGLHQALPDSDSLTVVAELARPQELLVHGARRLLDLKQHGLPATVSLHEMQVHPHSNAPDSHDLPHTVNALETSDQPLQMRRY